MSKLLMLRGGEAYHLEFVKLLRQALTKTLDTLTNSKQDRLVEEFFILKPEKTIVFVIHK